MNSLSPTGCSNPTSGATNANRINSLKSQPRNANSSPQWAMSASFFSPNRLKNSLPKPPTSRSNFRPTPQENPPAFFGPSAKAQIQPSESISPIKTGAKMPDKNL